jgi:hypothetical protein
VKYMVKYWMKPLIWSRLPVKGFGMLIRNSLGAAAAVAGRATVWVAGVADILSSSGSDSVSSDSVSSDSDSVSVVPSDTDLSVGPSLVGASCAGSKNSSDPSVDSESSEVGARKVRRLVDVMSYQGSGRVSVSFAGLCPSKGSGFRWVWTSKPREVDETKSLIFC